MQSSETKPGWKTTENAITMTIVVLIEEAVRTSSSEIVQASGLVALALLGVGYAWVRMGAKKESE